MWAMEVSVAIRVRVLNADVEHIDENLPHTPEDEVATILTSDYVRKVNLGISYRIQQREFSHTESLDMVAKAYFR